MITIPAQQKKPSQINAGDNRGLLGATYNMDFETVEGRMKVSPGMRELLTDADNEDFDGYAAAIFRSELGTGKFYAVSDKVFTTSSDNPTGSYSEETSGTEPDSGNTIMDGTEFDGKVLVIEATDIKASNGSTWSSWWQTTLAQSALTSGERHLVKVGPDGNCYIVNAGNLLYRVTPADVVTKTGNGTLDFSATPHIFQCMEPNSTRMWIGTKNLGREAVVIEWDMAPQSNAANRIHRMGCEAVWGILIFNDVPVAVCSDGKLRIFNGTSFIEWENMNIPTNGQVLDDEFMHPNGWDIIDGLPHILIRGAVKEATGTAYSKSVASPYQLASGVYCVDPEVGVYHRFAIGAGESSQFDYGQPVIKEVGALCATNDYRTKFLASYEYYTDSSTSVSVLAYHDAAKTKPTRGWFATTAFDTFANMKRQVRTLFKRLGTGDALTFFYRTHDAVDTVITGIWGSTTAFHTTDDTTGITGNMVAIIKVGNGAGQIVRITGVSRSTNTTVLTINEAPDFVAQDDAATLHVLNFKYLGNVRSQVDNKLFSIPLIENARRLQLLCLVTQAAGNDQELDYVIIE